MGRSTAITHRTFVMRAYANSQLPQLGYQTLRNSIKRRETLPKSGIATPKAQIELIKQRLMQAIEIAKKKE